MNRIAASLFAGLPIGALACGGPAAAVGHEGADATAMMFGETTPDLDGAGPIVAGDGGRCDGSPQGVLGTKVMLNVSWPATAAYTKGSGTVSLWLLLRHAVDGSGAIAGTVQTCGMQIPAFRDAVSCVTAVCPPETENPQLQLTIPAGSWDGTPTTPITGAWGGSSIGSIFAIDPVLTLFGLKPASALASASQAWPVSVTDLVASDLTYADGGAYQPGVGEPGILTIPIGNPPPDALPKTSLAVTAPQVDELWLVLRMQFSLHGTILSCTEQTGTVEVGHLDSRVVGCHLVDGGSCTMDQDVFVDNNRPWFVPTNGSFRAMPMVAAGCKDVLEKLP
jgi:hypothetical protein